MNIQLIPYPLEVMPALIREAVRQVFHNVQAPIALCAGSALAVVSACSAPKIKVVMPYGGEPKPTGLYLMTIADSGERKTAVDAIFSKVLIGRDVRAVEQHEAALARYQTDIRIWSKAERKLVDRIAERELNDDAAADLRLRLQDHVDRKPSPPRLRCQLHQDMSERAIMDALEGAGECIALICNEGEILLRSAVLEKPSLLNKAWDGGPFHFDRKDRKIVASDTRATVSVMVQSSVLQDYVSKRGDVVRGSGLWARFLVCKPMSTQGMRYTADGDPSWGEVDAFHERVRQVLDEGAGQVYEFDPDAKKEFIGLLNQIEAEIRPLSGYLSEIGDFASKAGENVARVAGLFHHFSDQPGRITVDTLQRAWQVVRWYLEETKRIFTPCVVPQVQVDAHSLELYLGAQGFRANTYAIISRNYVLRNGPVRKADRFSDALELLSSQGKIAIVVGSSRMRYIVRGPLWALWAV